jgi:hypothetical protein
LGTFSGAAFAVVVVVVIMLAVTSELAAVKEVPQAKFAVVIVIVEVVVVNIQFHCNKKNLVFQISLRLMLVFQ